MKKRILKTKNVKKTQKHRLKMAKTKFVFEKKHGIILGILVCVLFFFFLFATLAPTQDETIIKAPIVVPAEKMQSQNSGNGDNNISIMTQELYKPIGFFVKNIWWLMGIPIIFMIMFNIFGKRHDF